MPASNTRRDKEVSRYRFHVSGCFMFHVPGFRFEKSKTSDFFSMIPAIPHISGTATELRQLET
jgi:hypothetical protein